MRVAFLIIALGLQALAVYSEVSYSDDSTGSHSEDSMEDSKDPADTTTPIFCRTKPSRPNHMFSLWAQDFPWPQDTAQPSSLCEGTVTQRSNGEICIEGRVSYQQITEVVGNKAIFQPAARSISINGHLTAGSGNVVLGDQVHYLYDFVTSYVVDGVYYEASTNITDHMLTASRGTIDAVCLSADFQATESWYSISHKFYGLDSVDYAELRTITNVGLLFFGYFNSVLELHTPLDTTPALNDVSTFAYSTLMNFVNFGVGAFPASLYGLFPVFAVTGSSRVLVGGSYSTKKHPNPFIAPDNLGQVEGVQVDCHWTTLMDALEDGGLFRGSKKIPLYFNAVIKRIEAQGKHYTCWGEPGTITASIDLEAPAGWGSKLDQYIEEVVFPELSNRGPVSIHFGKRSPPNSRVLQSAINFYSDCGVATHLEIKDDNCYHPICDRTNVPRKFKYPADYYGNVH